MPMDQMGRGWERHYFAHSMANEAYVVGHGHHSEGWTRRTTPSHVHFYTFHGHSISMNEVLQVSSFRSVIYFTGRPTVCKPKIATSIAGPGTRVWNYSLLPLDSTEYYYMLEMWRSRPTSSHSDMILMNPGADVRHQFRLDDLFRLMERNRMRYEIIHFLCCRAGEGLENRTMPDVMSFFRNSNPYWPDR